MKDRAVNVPVAPAAPVDELQFRTDHLTGDLRRCSVRGGTVTLIAQVVKLLVAVGATAILARLLTPADFGLVAMTAAFVGFVSLFKDLGLSTATVQRADVTHSQVNTLFWINVVLSLLLMGIACALAPVVAWVYGEPRVMAIVMVVAGTFVFGGLTAQHTALLRRQMRFRALAVADITALVCASIAGILLAWVGAGYWALVGLSTTNALVTMIVVWMLSRWRPGAPGWGGDVWPMLRFGGHLTGFSVANYFTRNLDNALIGWYWGAGPLGLYAKAYGLLLLPVRQINAPISAVALPALSRLQNSPDRFRRFYLKATLAIATVGMPLVVCTFVLADEVILTLLGPQWSEAVAIYRILAIVAFIDTTNVAVGWIYVALGQTDRQFRWQVFEGTITVVSFVIGLQWGVVGVATAFAISRVLLRYPALLFCFKYAPVKMADFLGSMWRPAAASGAAGLTLFASLYGMTALPTTTRLVIGSALYVICYLLSWLLVPGGRALLRQLLGALDDLRPRDRRVALPVNGGL